MAGRRKKPDTVAPVLNMNEADRVLGEIAGIERELAAIESKMNQDIDAAKTRAKGMAGPLQDRRARLEAGLQACGASATVGARRSPILNSAIESNAGRVLSLRRECACGVVLLVSERLEGGVLERNVRPGEAVETARRLFDMARDAGFDAEDVYIDPGTPPISSDLEGLVNTALDTIERVRSDSDLGRAHILVGVSNFTAGLPRRVRLPLQNAFLTLAVGRGVDSLIGDAGREYRLLEPGDEHLAWLEHILSSTGTRRLGEITSSPLYRSPSGADR